MTGPLDAVEARILGSLLEKAKLTPDQYPLTFHALLLSCNQKTSREPIMSLDPNTLEKGLRGLEAKGLVERVHGPGSLVPKFRHHFENLLTLASEGEAGAICLLLLRGPQTAGELKSRSDRLHPFENAAQVETLLQGLATRPEGPVVERLPRQPGQKEARYRHLFGGEAPAGDQQPAPPPREAGSPLERRVAELERRVRALEERPPQTA